jgi:predicted RNA binding protein YcfA (HicA-like mRNA interferase family)/predicted RNase H-like HicB family nuclease
MKIFTAIVERDIDTSLYVGYVPGFQGAHSQAETLDELQENLREVIEMLLEDENLVFETEFVGTQQIMVAWVVSNIPVLKPQEVVRLLENMGFVEVRQRASHKQFRHEDGRGTTVPFHKGRDISPRLLRQIANDIGLNVEEMLESN